MAGSDGLVGKSVGYSQSLERKLMHEGQGCVRMLAKHDPGRRGPKKGYSFMISLLFLLCLPSIVAGELEV